MSKIGSRNMMLKEIMELAFTGKELNLYLDTHPYDSKAIEMYNSTVKKCKMAKYNYEKMYGPIDISSWDENTRPWAWIDSPWPWERMGVD